jgi:hypothetical protein
MFHHMEQYHDTAPIHNLVAEGFRERKWRGQLLIYCWYTEAKERSPTDGVDDGNKSPYSQTTIVFLSSSVD